MAAPKKDPVSKRSLRWEALRTVANSHADEFHDVLGKLYADHGLDYQRPITDEEKAQATIDGLLAKYPSLRGRVAPAVAASPAPLLSADDPDDELIPLATERIDPGLSRSKAR